MRPRNKYSHPDLDRRSEKRDDPDFVNTGLNQPTARIYPVCNGGNLMTDQPAPAAVCFNRVELEQIAVPLRYIYLGDHDGRPHFAGEMDAPDAMEKFSSLGQFRPLRDLGLHLDESDAAVLAYARGVLHWHSQHRHCGICGAPTDIASAGHVLKCTDTGCGKQHFPRSDPAVITLVAQGDRCVLARRSNWPEKRRSTVAGFVEPGEALEDAVVREVWEEVGLKVNKVQYHSSQPWPFPASLMLGFWAEAVTSDIQVDGDEISEAEWYTPRDIAEKTASGELVLPPEDSISFRLIQDWLTHIG